MLKESADLSGYVIAFHRCRDRSAVGMAQHIDHFCTQDLSSEFETANVFTGSHIAGNSRDKQIAEALIKHDLDGNSGICAAEKRGKWFLLLSDLANTIDVAIRRNRFAGSKAKVSILQQFQRSLRSLGHLVVRARCPRIFARMGSYPQASSPQQRMLQKISTRQRCGRCNGLIQCRARARFRHTFLLG